MKTKVILIIGIVLLIGIGIAAYFMFKGDKPEPETDTSKGAPQGPLDIDKMESVSQDEIFLESVTMELAPAMTLSKKTRIGDLLNTQNS